MVDDEPMVVRVVTTALSLAGFRAAVAENGAAGLDAYLKRRDEICLVLADIMMPVTTGVEMADKIRKLNPGVPILLMSGYSDQELACEAQRRYPLIRKPFLAADLIRKIQAMLAVEDRTTNGPS